VVFLQEIGFVRVERSPATFSLSPELNGSSAVAVSGKPHLDSGDGWNGGGHEWIAVRRWFDLIAEAG